MAAEPGRESNQRTTGSREQIALSLQKIEETARTIRTAIRVAGWCFAALVLLWIVDALAGRETSLIVRVALNVLFDFRFALLLGGTAASVVWALAERRLRQRTIQRLHPRIKQLETMLDPGRTTSNLTPKGETNPMDDEP